MVFGRSTESPELGEGGVTDVSAADETERQKSPKKKYSSSDDTPHGYRFMMRHGMVALERESSEDSETRHS